MLGHVRNVRLTLLDLVGAPGRVPKGLDVLVDPDVLVRPREHVRGFVLARSPKAPTTMSGLTSPV